MAAHPTKPPSGSLAAALAEASAEFRLVAKSGENKFDKYKYAMLEDYIESVRPVLHKHGLSVSATVDELIPLDDRETKGGTREHVVRVRMTGTLLHVSGESLSVCMYGEGQDRADKSIYKAITGCRKYLLASLLNLATSDDPEADENTGRDTEQAAPKARSVKDKLSQGVDLTKKSVIDALLSRGWTVPLIQEHMPTYLVATFGKATFAGLSQTERVALHAAAMEGKLDSLKTKGVTNGVVQQGDPDGEPF